MKATVTCAYGLAALCATASCSRGSTPAQVASASRPVQAATVSPPTEAAIPAQAAAKAFQEASALCQAEGGKLWGESLCGPMMFVDPATRQAVLRSTSPGAVSDGPVFRLDLPARTGIANTSLELGGQRWSMITWPLPEDATERGTLMMHESYHRIQPALGLEAKGGMGKNTHLDTRDGRVWLRGELHALAAALRAEGEARRSALSDALIFRAYRQSMWPEAASQERGLELNEGLAESTGIDAAVSAAASRLEATLADLAQCEASPSLVRSFAYGTGPAYGELLNAIDPAWRRGVRRDFDLSVAAGAAYKIVRPALSKGDAETALARHDGPEIVLQEDARQKAIGERNARFARLFLDGPTVKFQLAKMNMSFNPWEVVGFEDHGTVYSTLQLSDEWGTLEVKSGAALISKDFKQVLVPAAAETAPGHTEGRGWTVSLANGYTLAPDPARSGSFKAVAKERD